MENIITSKDLKLYYGNFEALKGITVEIAEREITALIGPSGCGKSTFLKTLNRMNDLVQGVRVEGQYPGIAGAIGTAGDGAGKKGCTLYGRLY